MPFIPPPPSKPQNQSSQSFSSGSSIQTNNTAENSIEGKNVQQNGQGQTVNSVKASKKKGVSKEKQLKILFFFLSALCFAGAIVIFTLMFVL